MLRRRRPLFMISYAMLIMGAIIATTAIFNLFANVDKGTIAVKIFVSIAMFCLSWIFCGIGRIGFGIISIPPIGEYGVFYFHIHGDYLLLLTDAKNEYNQKIPPLYFKIPHHQIIINGNIQEPRYLVVKERAGQIEFNFGFKS